MKRLFQLIFFLGLSLSLTAQSYNVNVSGTVTDSNGQPVGGVGITILIAQNPGGGFFYNNFLQTAPDGSYSDQIEVPNSSSQGLLTVEMVDCDSSLVSRNFGFFPGNTNNFTADFDWCATVVSNPCDVAIEVDNLPGTTSLVLTAVPAGTAPFTFYWNNAGGTNDPSITVNQSGTYCVAVWDTTGCSATACVTVQIGGSNDCAVYIFLDSTAAGGLSLFADASGTPPFTYLWNTGQTTQSIGLDPSMLEYCVTVTAADGCVATDCILFPEYNCSVSIIQGPDGGLTANPSGTAPFIFFWNTNETGPTIYPNASGLYCVTVIDADSCAATECYQYWNGGGQDSCGVIILVDSAPPGSTGNLLTALAFGTPPFTYQWNVQNWQAQSIIVPGNGTYCVTVTDAQGWCVSSACVTLGFQPCQVEIVEVTSGPPGNENMLVAAVPANAYQFLWSTGETTPAIVPSGPGTYCVTVTHSSGCTATDCYEYSNFGIFSLKGFVTLPDSNFFALLAGTVTLYQFDPLTLEPVQVEDTLLNITPNGLVNFYDFGGLSEGQYLVKVTLDPNSPYADDYLPTYYGNVLYWDEATPITIPSAQDYFNIVLVKGQGVNGPGVINGTVTDGDGLTANDGDDRGAGDPVPGVSILLLDELEQPITDALTDEAGTYSFPALPYGTYKVVVEIVGLDQAFSWVTLSAENPGATLNFQVTEAGVVMTGIGELAAEAQRFQVSPNPVNNVLHVALDVAAANEASLMLSNTAGTIVAARHLALAAGHQTFEFNVSHLPSGIYFLQLVSRREVVSRRIVIQ
ncbi:MAG: T9SS type A sorting domain-containing protein [Saprospiraceae bacterium]|nr:MAG: T9SS type A sorting domain-containing protein [Saprospiraceae bacterium]